MSPSSTAHGAGASNSGAPKAPPQAQRRPGRYTPTTGQRICQRLAEGESLRAICGHRSMPCWETVKRWLRQRPKFRVAYADAREHQAYWLAA